MMHETWGMVRQELRKKIGPNNYQTWIEPLEFDGLADGVLTLRVQSNFVGNWVDRYYGDPIKREVEAAGSPVRRLNFVVGKPANAAAAPARATPQAQPAASPAAPAEPAEEIPASPAFSGAPLDEKFTFDRFVVGKPNELAYAAAQRVAEGGQVGFNPLFLYGGNGLGKTHLMHAIAWQMQARAPQARVLYLSAEQFMYRFIQALRDHQMMDFKHVFRSVDVLMVDDVQFIAGKDSTQEEFFHTFNALVDQRKQIILTADVAPGEIPGLQNRIVSRLQSGLVVDVHPTSYELRLGILQRKLDYQIREFGNARLGDGVLELLAARITSNVRELEGALVRLLAHSAFLDRELDVDLAQECLRDLLKIQDRKSTVEEILRKTAEHYNIRYSDLVGPKRTRIFARPRQVAMYLAKELTDRSLPEIARRFGNRDHTTIIYGIRKVEKLLDEDAQIAEDIDLLRRALRS